MNFSSRQIFADLELARRLERAEGHANARFVEARRELEPSSGAEWIEVAGAYALFDGVDSPLTQSFGLGLFETCEGGHLDKIESFFESRGAGVQHEISPIALMQPPLLQLLNARGYQPVEFSSVLYQPIPNSLDLPQPRNERILVREIGPEEKETWVEISVEGWSEHPELADYLRGIGSVMANRKDGYLFLAELEGKAIAAAAISVHAGVLLLAGAATIPSARRQGAQLALLSERLRRGRQLGCDLAMMAAQPGSASQRNAERRGFRIAYTRVKFGLGG